jgi:HEPN domain-containing protein
MLAETKFLEAECLVQNGFFDGAYYVGGYAIELLLKARICKTLGVDNFYMFDKAQKDLYRPFKVHDYGQLMLLSGIYDQFVSEQDIKFRTHWAMVKDWNEAVRYERRFNESDAKVFLISLFEVMQWIKKFL